MYYQSNPLVDMNEYFFFFLNYEVITKLKQKDSEYQRAVFLHTVGPEGLNIFNSITFERDGDYKKVDVIIQKMNSVIIGETNEIYVRFIFNKWDQKQGELKHHSLCDRVETTCYNL